MSDRQHYIALLEDDDGRRAEMQRCLLALCPGRTVCTFEDSKTMIDWLNQNRDQVDLISLDHDLPIRRDGDNRLVDYGDGLKVAEYLASLHAFYPVIIHTSNWSAGCSMMQVFQQKGWLVARVVPHDDVLWIDQEWKENVARLLDGSRQRSQSGTRTAI